MLESGTKESMRCDEPDCNGQIIEGRCDKCGSENLSGDKEKRKRGNRALTITSSVRALLQEKQIDASKDDLLNASRTLEEVVPDNFQAWRTQADLLVSAVRQLEIRQIEPDESVQLIGVPLRESA